MNISLNDILTLNFKNKATIIIIIIAIILIFIICKLAKITIESIKQKKFTGSMSSLLYVPLGIIALFIELNYEKIIEKLDPITDKATNYFESSLISIGISKNVVGIIEFVIAIIVVYLLFFRKKKKY